MTSYHATDAEPLLINVRSKYLHVTPQQFDIRSE